MQTLQISETQEVFPMSNKQPLTCQTPKITAAAAPCTLVQLEQCSNGVAGGKGNKAPKITIYQKQKVFFGEEHGSGYWVVGYCWLFLFSPIFVKSVMRGVKQTNMFYLQMYIFITPNPFLKILCNYLILYFTQRCKGAKKKKRVLAATIFKKSVQISRTCIIHVLIFTKNHTH